MPASDLASFAYQVVRFCWVCIGLMVLSLVHGRALFEAIWAAVVTVIRLLHLLITVRRHSLIYTGKYFSIADQFEQRCDKNPSQVIFVDASEGGKETTMADLDELANQVAHWGMGVGFHVSGSDCVALMMENRSEFVSFWYGMAKIGVPVALINTGSVGIALTHSVQKALEGNQGPKILVTTRTLYGGIDATAQTTLESQGIQILVWEDLDGSSSPIARQTKSRPSHAVRAHVRESDVLLYIYTSGTTGLPKASKISHTRYIVASSPFRCLCALTPQDRIYTPLPLYHSSAVLMGVGSAIYSGCTMVIRRKFSVRSFTTDCLKYNISVVQYIGELCRYLKDASPHEEDNLLSIRMAFGNGLRPDVWLGFKKRYGVASICEFYAATEGNMATFCIDKPGAVGFVPRFASFIYPVKIVRSDVESGLPIRDPVTGLCSLCGPNEPGLVLGEINDRRSDRRFDGYTDKQASNKKILRDVFKKGDKFFNSGDVLSQDAIGYFYWCDRTGDTLRWKGENVSCSEVENALSLIPNVEEVAVYPVEVPGHDGKACMAALVLEPDATVEEIKEDSCSERDVRPAQRKTRSSCSLDTDGTARIFSSNDWVVFDATVKSQLPPAARPLFIRFTREIGKTETFKLKKGPLKAAGFDPKELPPSDSSYLLGVRTSDASSNGSPRPRLIDEVLYGELKKGKITL